MRPVFDLLKSFRRISRSISVIEIMVYFLFAAIYGKCWLDCFPSLFPLNLFFPVTQTARKD